VIKLEIRTALAVLDRVSYRIGARWILSDEVSGYRKAREVSACEHNLSSLFGFSTPFLSPKRAGRITGGAERGEVIDGTQSEKVAISAIVELSRLLVHILVLELSHVSQLHRRWYVVSQVR
jgi:hypothetical protein